MGYNWKATIMDVFWGYGPDLLNNVGKVFKLLEGHDHENAENNNRKCSKSV